jgi:hypothetical protein
MFGHSIDESFTDPGEVKQSRTLVSCLRTGARGRKSRARELHGSSCKRYTNSDPESAAKNASGKLRNYPASQGAMGGKSEHGHLRVSERPAITPWQPRAAVAHHKECRGDLDRE